MHCAFRIIKQSYSSKNKKFPLTDSAVTREQLHLISGTVEPGFTLTDFI